MGEPTAASGCLDWDRFVGVLADFVPDLGSAEIEPGGRIRDRFPGSVERSIVFGVIARLGRGLPEDLVAGVDTFGEAHGWCAARWDGEPFPDDHRDATAFDGAPPARVRLVTIEPAHLPALYRASVSPTSGFRWRFRGSMPTFADFQAHLLDGVLCGFIVESVEGRQAHGWVVAYDVRFDAGHVRLGFVRISGQGSGEMTEGLFLFVEHLLRTWAFRKVYADIPAFNWEELVGTPVEDGFIFPRGGPVARPRVPRWSMVGSAHGCDHPGVVGTGRVPLAAVPHARTPGLTPTRRRCRCQALASVQGKQCWAPHLAPIGPVL